MASNRPAFLITIDTEGDNLWSRPQVIETRNAEYVGRFQTLCEEFNFKPTWLTNYEMATSEKFIQFGRDVLKRRAGEIGMHLHAWNSPPTTVNLGNDFHYQPFLIEYPQETIDEKVGFMTELLRDRFETEIVSHRAGRWAFDSTYAKILAKYGYLVDCSVTPHVSWADTTGSPSGSNGTDYTNFPNEPYLLDLDHVDRPGGSQILELPATVERSSLHQLAPWAYEVSGLRRFAWKYQPKHIWLYPDGSNLAHMTRLVRESAERGKKYVEFVLHSSELMPGGSPNFPDETCIERLYADLRILFTEIAKYYDGMTLSEYRTVWLQRYAKVREPAFA